MQNGFQGYAAVEQPQQTQDKYRKHHLKRRPIGVGVKERERQRHDHQQQHAKKHKGQLAVLKTRGQPGYVSRRQILGPRSLHVRPLCMDKAMAREMVRAMALGLMGLCNTMSIPASRQCCSSKGLVLAVKATIGRV